MTNILGNQKRSWWILLLRGIAAMVFGVLAFALPGETILALTLILGLWVVADGIIEIGYAFYSHNWWRIALGLLGIATGIYTVVYPQLAAFLLILLIAGWMILHGVVDVVDAVRLRERLLHEWVLVLAGIVSIVLGISLAAFPGAGGNVIVGLLGVYALIYGVLTIVDAFRMRASEPGFSNVSRHGQAA